MSNHDRMQAYHILNACLSKKIPLSTVMREKEPVAPYAKVLCFGVCRHYFRLYEIIKKLTTKLPKDEVLVALLMGLYEIQYLEKPEYVAVKEAVNILHVAKKLWAKGFVNAVLREFCREKVTVLASLADNPGFKYGQAAWLITKVKLDWPNDWVGILQALDNHPPLTLRVNQQRLSQAAYLEKLKSEASATALSPVGVILTKECSAHEIPGFSEGEVSIQDESAQLATVLLDVKPHEKVLDACAAPGGKTCHLLEVEPTLDVLALDISDSRLKRIQSNLDRLHLKAVLKTGDASVPDTWWDGQLFDKILLDAPCSATGVMRRQPDIRLQRTDDSITEIKLLQASILRSLWPLLKSGGLLVYATCSIFKDENEHQIRAFLKANADASVQPIPPSYGHITDVGCQVFPGDNNRDGFFYSVLLKR